MNKLIKHIVFYKNTYFIGVLAVLVLLGSQVKKPAFDGSFESIGIQENHYITDYKDIDSIFQESHKVFVEVVPKEVALSEIIKDMDAFEANLKPLFDTISFRSVLKLSHLFYNSKKRRKVSAQQALKKFSKVKLFKDLISKDQKSYLLVLGVEVDTAETIVGKINTALEMTTFSAVEKVNITSPFHIEASINKVLIHDLGKIIVSIFFAFLLIMIVAYRSVFSILYMVMIVTFTLLGTFFVFQFFGKPFNLITLMVLPVVIVLSVADGIHLLTGMSEQSASLSLSERLRNVYQKYALPSLLTSITTAVAFLSLSFNHTKSVVHLGQITGISILVSYFLCYLATPFIFIKWYKSKNINRHFSSIAAFFQRHTKVFTYLLLPLVVIALVLMPRLQFKNDFEIFLPMKSEAKIQHDSIKQHYYSQAAIEVAFRLKDTLNKTKVLSRMNKEFKRIEGIELVRGSETSSFVKGRFMIPIDISKLSSYKKRFEADHGFIQRVQLKVEDPNLIPTLEEKVRVVLQKQELEEVKLTSPALVFSFVNKEVANSLIKSLLFSSLFLLLVFYGLTKDIVRALIGMLANIVPLSVIFILFVWLDLNINIVTSVTAVVCLGLIVDDTIHAFYRKVVLHKPLEELGFGMLTTTIILVVGFGLFALSSIKPIIIFGVISAIVFVVTLISDFTLLFYFLDKYEKYLHKKRNS